VDIESPLVAFLGVCQGSLLQTVEGSPDFWKEDLFGLTTIVPCAFFPWTLRGLRFVFATSDFTLLHNSRFRVTWPDGVTFRDFGVELYRTDDPDAPFGDPPPVSGLEFSPDWKLLIWNAPDVNFVAGRGRYKVTFHQREQERTIGWLTLEHVPPPPLTPDRIEAIRTNPAALRHCKLLIECTECCAGITPYTALERCDDYEKKGYVWYKDLPDTFDCYCGKVRIDLTLLREHFHSILGSIPDVDGTASFTSPYHYQRSKLESLCTGFAQLLDRNPSEEEVQKFIEENQVLLSSFGARRIFRKAPILTRYKTDFALLTHNKELILIELERPGIRLMTKTGGVSAELQHPVDQVKDWLHLSEDHKGAVLAGIGNLTLADVTKIQGVVIAGRDKGYDPEHLRHLNWMDFGSNIRVMTYDHFVGLVVSWVRAMGNL
jgi:hypothetical protein